MASIKRRKIYGNGNLLFTVWTGRDYYPPGSIPFRAQLHAGVIAPDAAFSLPVHPVQLYLSLNGLVVFVLLSWIGKRYKPRSGVLFLLFWVFYSLGRFFLEYFRGDTSRGFVGPFSTGQFMSLMIFTLSMAGIYVLSFRQEHGINLLKGLKKVILGKSTLSGMLV